MWTPHRQSLSGGKRPWVQVPPRKTVELQITHHYTLGKRAGWPGIFYFSGQMKTQPLRFLSAPEPSILSLLACGQGPRLAPLPTAHGKRLLLRLVWAPTLLALGPVAALRMVHLQIHLPFLVPSPYLRAPLPLLPQAQNLGVIGSMDATCILVQAREPGSST